MPDHCSTYPVALQMDDGCHIVSLYAAESLIPFQKHCRRDLQGRRLAQQRHALLLGILRSFQGTRGARSPRHGPALLHFRNGRHVFEQLRIRWQLTTGSKAGAFLVAGPGWRGQKPNDVREVIHSPTPYALVFGRTYVEGPTMLPMCTNCRISIR
jgi:hypothetical protein